MSEGFSENFSKSFRNILTLGILSSGFVLLSIGWVAIELLPTDDHLLVFVIMFGAWILIATLIAQILAEYLLKPVSFLAQAILHVSPHEHLVAAPNLEQLTLGRELVSNLTRQIYDFAATSQQIPANPGTSQDLSMNEIPIPVIGLSADGTVTSANTAALETFKLDKLVGMSFGGQLQLTYQNNSETLGQWLGESRQHAVNAQKSWQKVEIKDLNGNGASYFDVVATFRQSHPSGTETLLAFFNHSEAYETEGEAIGFISLAVHELRTPLTIMRGYIEVFETDLAPKLDDEMKLYLNRLSASAQSLTSFVNNILSVAKAEQSQLNLRLSEEQWSKTLEEIINVMRLRAKVRGKEITLMVAPNLPTVAIDRVSVSEVITNLIDNAIKYSPEEAKTITVNSTLDTDGNVLTTIQDHGVGIPESVVPNLFNKFYRNHRNRAQIVGTGLGLYISKAIVTAHHGNIWVKSKEGQGSTFGFTVLPYAKLADALKKDNNNDMIRASHGWIKNHSMQRQ